MHLTKALGSSALAMLAMSQVGSAWLTGYWATQNACNDIRKKNEPAADTERGGLPGQQKTCDIIGITGINAMFISEWEPNCEITLYKADSECGPGDVVKHWARSDVDYQTDGDYVCINNLGGIDVSFAYTCNPAKRAETFSA